MIVTKTTKLRKLPGYIGPPLLFLFALDLAIAAAYVFLGWKWIALPDIPLSIFGGVIGVIAGFRNASAYARWWEARTIWGGVVNQSRSFARQVISWIGATETGETPAHWVCETKRRLIFLQIAYVHALRNHLRGTPPWPELSALIPEEEIACWKKKNNVPIAIQQQIASELAGCYQRRWIDSIRSASMDTTLSSLMDCQGAAERIKNTPMPLLYDMFIRLFIAIYCVLLPLGMVQSLGLLTPVGSTLVGFMFLALDQIGRDLEAPFENLPHDVSLTAISRTIEINLRQMIDDREVPSPAVAVDGILW